MAVNIVPVLIVGAGPTGLALALWLTKLGIPVRIIDKNEHMGVGTRAVIVHARTLEFYRQVGIADNMVSGGLEISGINLWSCGKKKVRIRIDPIGEYLSPYPFFLSFPQDLHEKTLVSALAAHNVTVERSTTLVRFNQEQNHVEAILKLPDGAEETVMASYLAGCDGAHSTTRNRLGLDFIGGTYEGLFYVADVTANGPPINSDIHIDIDEGDFIGIFPYQEPSHVRLIGTVQTKANFDDNTITFEEVKGRAIDHMHITINQVNWFSTYRVHHRIARQFRVQRVFLLGDAAHIHSPVGGQGMNTGIGDAVNLAWKIAAVLNNKATSALLDTFEIERAAFARRLVSTTDRAFTLIAKHGRFAQWLRTQIVPPILAWLFKMPIIRRLAFRTLSQIGIHYRMSPLSVGKADALRGGDRLPWVKIDVTKDNFMPLSSLQWQVHIYGDAKESLINSCAEHKLSLHVFNWQTTMEKVGLVRNALYLVRPDGYIALADPSADGAQLTQYLQNNNDRGMHATNNTRHSRRQPH